MLSTISSELLDKLKYTTELKIVRFGVPDNLSEGERPSGLIQFPSALLIFDRVEYEQYTNASKIARYFFELWVFSLYTRGTYEEAEQELLNLCEVISLKLEEDPYLSVEAIKRIGLFGDTLCFALEISILGRR